MLYLLACVLNILKQYIVQFPGLPGTLYTALPAAFVADCLNERMSDHMILFMGSVGTLSVSPHWHDLAHLYIFPALQERLVDKQLSRSLKTSPWIRDKCF